MHPFEPDPEVSFRLAEAGDALCLGVLGTQVFLDTYATHGIRPTLAREVLLQFSAEALALRLQQPQARVVVAEREGHLIGYAQLTLGATQSLVREAAAAELDKLYVQRPFLGQGIGAALLHRAERLAAEQGVRVLWLTAWVHNERALGFYARQGYEELGITHYVFENECHENRVFAKALTAAPRKIPDDSSSGGASRPLREET